ncbi:MAG: LysE family transporter [Alphaproteobacteria bacterium]|nr:LysE family transporter [Alphaproteobacteria bacterium]
MEGLFGFILAGVALLSSPGPANLSLAAIGAAFGARRGLGYMAGIAIGMIIVMGIIATGVMGVLLAMPGAAPVLTTLAAAYIVYLAYRIATAPLLTESTDQHRQPSFFGGVFLSLVNPKAYAAVTALFSGFVLVEGALKLDVALKIAIVLTIFSSSNVVWLFVGASLTQIARDPAINRAINMIFAVLLVASVALALLF